MKINLKELLINLSASTEPLIMRYKEYKEIRDLVEKLALGIEAGQAEYKFMYGTQKYYDEEGENVIEIEIRNRNAIIKEEE